MHTVSMFTRTAVQRLSNLSTLARKRTKAMKELLPHPFIPSNKLRYTLKTTWLFTYSDATTSLMPWALFGITHALSAPLFYTSSQPVATICFRAPLVLFWLLINLLPFCISNQRYRAAILEDSINKPWRPIPSKRISPGQATDLMIKCHLFALIASSRLGGMKQCIAIIVLAYIYNDLRGGERSVVARNFLNGLGFVTFGSGAMDVAACDNFVFTPKLMRWFGMIVLVITSGIHTMDMYDQEGDEKTGKRTVPLVIGDLAARWSIIVVTMFWSVVCPWYWAVGFTSYSATLTCGITVAVRYYGKRRVDDDKKTFKVWSMWLVCIYCLPLMKMLGV